MAAARPPLHRTKRISLTKTQLRSGLGAELLSICETITADGRISEEEAGDLRQWLVDSGDADLPATSYLREVIERIIADSRITADEYRELYCAVEKVLPPEVRRQAVAARREVETSERAAARTARELELQTKREAQQRNAPIARANFMVAGIRHEGRPAVIKRHAHAGDHVRLVRDRDNRYSPHAIAVCLENGQQIGFVPEIDAEELAPAIDQGARCAAYMTKILTGGRSPIPVVTARFYRSDSTVDVDELARSGAQPGRTRRRSGGRSRWVRPPFWLLWVVVLFAVLIVLQVFDVG